ncbi:CYFA0S02e08031g_1 [Cyberlindnera fabianii]|uniref:CYFA0S02e08031g_1 n=1 Tax=Cyberlindnera fabianii TaxID=36022 RepID=A0A061AMW3_CYBFA|nr:CYFA0S02e08031g_1 [Cyberlindnera fabianii]
MKRSGRTTTAAGVSGITSSTEGPLLKKKKGKTTTIVKSEPREDTIPPQDHWIPGDKFEPFGPDFMIHRDVGLVVNQMTGIAINPLDKKFLNADEGNQSLVDHYKSALETYERLYLLRDANHNWSVIKLTKNDNVPLKKGWLCGGCWKYATLVGNRPTRADHLKTCPKTHKHTWFPIMGIDVVVDGKLWCLISSIVGSSVSEPPSQLGVTAKDDLKKVNDNAVTHQQSSLITPDTSTLSPSTETAVSLVSQISSPEYKYANVVTVVDEFFHSLTTKIGKNVDIHTTEFVATSLVIQQKHTTTILQCIALDDWCPNESLISEIKSFILMKDSDIVMSDTRGHFDLKLSLRQHNVSREKWMVSISGTSKRQSALGEPFIRSDKIEAESLQYLEMCHLVVLYRCIINAVITCGLKGEDIPGENEMATFVELCMGIGDPEKACAAISGQLYTMVFPNEANI